MTIVGAGIDTTTLATTGTNGIVVSGSIRPNPTLTLADADGQEIDVDVRGDVRDPGELVCLAQRTSSWIGAHRQLHAERRARGVSPRRTIPGWRRDHRLDDLKATLRRCRGGRRFGLRLNSTIRTNLGGGLRATFTSEFGRVAVMNSTFNDNQALARRRIVRG